MKINQVELERMKIIGVLWINLTSIPLTVNAVLHYNVIHFTDAKIQIQKKTEAVLSSFVPNLLKG